MELWAAEYVCIKGRFETDWGLLVDDTGIIKAIGPRQQLVARARTVYHYPGKVLMPAFLNPHHHGFHRAFRGVSDFDISFSELINKLIWPVSHAIDDELFEAVIQVAFAEQAQAGVAAVGDFHYLHNGQHEDPGKARFAEKIIRIAVEMGIRLTLVYAFFDQGSSETARAFIRPLDVSLEEFEHLQASYSKQPLIQIMPGVHSLEHTSSEAIIAAAELAEKYDTKLHIQLAERENELDSARIHYGTTPLRALEKMGILNERLVIINGTLLDEEEMAMARDHKVSMILCPGAALARGDDLPNTWSVLKHKIPFAAGSDSAIMNHNYLIPEDIKLLEYTQRSTQRSMNVLATQTGVTSLWDLASKAPAPMLGVPSAQLMPDNPADFMIIAPSQDQAPSPKLPGHHFSNQMLYGWGAQARVTHLMVQGKLVVSNSYPTTDLTASYQKLARWNEAFLRSIKRSNTPQS